MTNPFVAMDVKAFTNLLSTNNLDSFYSFEKNAGIRPSATVVEKVINEDGEAESSVQMDCCHAPEDSE